MLTLLLSLAFLVSPDPTLTDLQTLHQTVVADQAAGKLPAPPHFNDILPFITNAQAKYATGTRSSKSIAKSYMLSLKMYLPFVFQVSPTLTAADKALLVSEVNQILADMGP